MSDSNLKTLRDGYGQGLLELGRDNPQIVALTADLAESTRCHWFAKEFPERFIQCGVAEQNMMGTAVGLALGGKIPFVNSFAVFSPGRNWDQLRVSVCYSNLPVIIAGHHTGLSATQDGATHQALEDIAITRVLPNLAILTPATPGEAKQSVFEAVIWGGPLYIRLSKYQIPENRKSKFEIGKGEILQEGMDLTIICAGPMVWNALKASNELRDTISIEVILLYSLKPIDTRLIIQSAQKTGRVLTIEDHQITGGLGSAVAEILSENHPVPVYRHGIYDQFGESGSEGELLRKYGLDTEGVKRKIEEVIRLSLSSRT